MQARAIVGDGAGSFSVEEIEVGEPQGDEVLVAIKAAGVCHTDFDTLRLGYPLILGHEGAGVVQAVGPQVASVRPGDAVLRRRSTICTTAATPKGASEGLVLSARGGMRDVEANIDPQVIKARSERTILAAGGKNLRLAADHRAPDTIPHPDRGGPDLVMAGSCRGTLFG